MITRHAQLATVIAAIALSAGLSMPVSAQDRPAQNQTQASRLPAIVVTKATTYLIEPGWRFYAAAQGAVWFTRGGH